MKPILFEGWMANGIAPGGQLTTTTDVENFPGFPKGIQGIDFTMKLRDQSLRFGTEVHTETVTHVDLSSRPFKVYTDDHEVKASTVIVATGAIARRLDFPGAGEAPEGYWSRGISACAVCDGAAPIFRKKTVVVVGGGDSAMEEAGFLTKYASKVLVVHRRGELRASKIMQERARNNPKIEFVLNAEVVEARGDGSTLQEVVVRSGGKDTVVQANGLFFAIGHTPASAFLQGQLDLDEEGYIVTPAGTVATSVAGVFACGDVQDKQWRQAVTAAGTGCMAALSAERFLASLPSE